MTKGHRPPHSRRSGLDGKQKAQIAVAVVTTLSSGAETSPDTRGVGQVTLFGSPLVCHIGMVAWKEVCAFTWLRGG